MSSLLTRCRAEGEMITEGGMITARGMTLRTAQYNPEDFGRSEA